MENINTKLNQVESNLESHITKQANENIMNIKDSIVTALKHENKTLQVKAKIPKKKKLAEKLEVF